MGYTDSWELWLGFLVGRGSAQSSCRIGPWPSKGFVWESNKTDLCAKLPGEDGSPS